MTRVNGATRKEENYRLEVETAGWRDHIRNVKGAYYSNTADIIDQVVWSLVEGNSR